MIYGEKISRLKFVKTARIWSYQNLFVWLEYENPFSEPKGLFWQCDQMARMFLQYLGIYNNSNKTFCQKVGSIFYNTQ